MLISQGVNLDKIKHTFSIKLYHAFLTYTIVTIIKIQFRVYKSILLFHRSFEGTFQCSKFQNKVVVKPCQNKLPIKVIELCKFKGHKPPNIHFSQSNSNSRTFEVQKLQVTKSPISKAPKS